ncbi:hypothetical protein GGE07_004014 [Sinorhizobium terangae]|uniref:Uncharacterized protein n=1 Tax=Sinorhizobium terangae TaxID=110322 RepID=A0A6N7LBR7_SINTE|nr:hypothetical protein [Sinorhizobium terangae]MBB4187350.1 hypothetical protein [Sinorhizobium terangae]MQX14639.1 hypothetical protein [Sinorhizobium terangae]
MPKVLRRRPTTRIRNRHDLVATRLLDDRHTIGRERFFEDIQKALTRIGLNVCSVIVPPTSTR